jgi:hypothetical protein
VETADERMLRRYGDVFERVACAYCDGTAARWKGSRWTDAGCRECEDAAEAAYAAQGGQ